MPVLALWSAPRSRSTAFFRSVLERGDQVMVHEPFSDLAGLGETDVDGRVFRAPDRFLAWLRDETGDLSVFVKDTPDSRHRYLLDDEVFLSKARHTFLIRRPEEIAASYHAIEPNRSIHSIGLAFLHRLYVAVEQAGGHRPLVIDSDDLVTRPEATMAAYCAAVGLPERPEALSWAPGHRSEWRRSARWHEDVAASSGFERRQPRHETTVETSEELARFAAENGPFYRDLHARRLEV